MMLGNKFLVILVLLSKNFIPALAGGWVDSHNLEPPLDIDGQEYEEVVVADNEDDDDETLERKKNANRNTIPYGQPCDKGKPADCKLYPIIQCINVVAKKYVCRCDFLHTWNATEEKCIINVLAPCLIEGKIIPCSKNMECVNDTLGISDEDRFCRCVKGFKMAENEDLIPAFCVPDDKYVEEEEEIYIKSTASVINTYITVSHFFLAVSCALSM